MSFEQQLTLEQAALPAPAVHLCDCGNRKFSALTARCETCAAVLLAEVERLVGVGADGWVAAAAAWQEVRNARR